MGSSNSRSRAKYDAIIVHESSDGTYHGDSG
jgi:hypothetical protein